MANEFIGSLAVISLLLNLCIGFGLFYCYCVIRKALADLSTKVCAFDTNYISSSDFYRMCLALDKLIKDVDKKEELNEQTN